MRFFADGPDIPDELLEARDAGEVVFLCGAGVSATVGLPGFARLAQLVADALGVPTNSAIRQAIASAKSPSGNGATVPLDQVFAALQREYGRDQVENAVRQKLRRPKNVDLTHHKIVLRLSSDTHGHARVVTTNFDTLFQASAPGSSVHTAPSLPDIAASDSFEGIACIHGSLQSSPARTRLILSSADFGLAYLADGWAAKFMRDLFARYTVVLLGYSASDAPVSYLLEGMRSRPSPRPQKLYAFYAGRPGETDARWWERGVQAIPYVDDGNHTALWTTLGAWADRADDPISWRASVVAQARRGPRALAPHERGQVASLVSSALGAKAFASADPPPPAEWLAVFDPSVRCAKEQKVLTADGSLTFNPADLFGLDSDIVVSGDEAPPSSPADLLSALSKEECSVGAIALAGFRSGDAAPLPKRLDHLAGWIRRVAGQSVALWWAAGKLDLHGDLKTTLRREYRRPGAMPEHVARGWRLLLEAFSSDLEQSRTEWYALRGRKRLTGSDIMALRDLERVLVPSLSATRGAWSIFLSESYDRLRLSQLVNFEVEFIEETGGLEFDDVALPQALAAVRRGLVEAADLHLLTESGPFHVISVEPSAGGEEYPSEEDAYFRWFATLFSEVCDRDPAAARTEYAAWPEREIPFFDKLRVWALGKPQIFSADEAAEGLLKLSDEDFWSRFLQKELLQTTRAIWPGTGEETRRALEDRLIRGPEMQVDEKEGEYQQRRGASAATRLAWLLANGCKLSPDTERKLPELKAADPRWRDSWAMGADMSFDSVAHTIVPDTDPAALMRLPVGEVAATAKKISEAGGFYTDRDPFRGLVVKSPLRAVAVLAAEFRQGRFDPALWGAALNYWPETAPRRVTWLFAGRLKKLPAATGVEISRSWAQWLQKQWPNLAERPEDRWLAWDAALSADRTRDLSSADVSTRRPYEDAINSSVGILAQILVTSIERPVAGAGLPQPIASRMTALLGMQNGTARFAAAVLAHYLVALHAIDEKWALKNLVPLLVDATIVGRSAWDGFFFRAVLPPNSLMRRIKKPFLKLFNENSPWIAEGTIAQRAGEYLALAALESEPGKAISFKEARAALQASNDRVRLGALRYLRLTVKDEAAWKARVRRFLTSVWPKELRYQTVETSRQIAALAPIAGSVFPLAVHIGRPFIRPTDSTDTVLSDLMKPPAGGHSTVATFPREVVELLDRMTPEEPRWVTPHLRDVVDAAAEADPSLRHNLQWKRLFNLAAGS